MFDYQWLFLMQAVMAILMFIFLRKLNQIKKQMDTITKEVMTYISYVVEEEEEEKEGEIMLKSRSKETDKNQEEAQNSLIQAVLGEYFP